MKLRNILAAAALSVIFAAQAETPKYIFYFIGDGMGMGPVMAAQTYKRMVQGDDKGLLMTQFPHAGWARTFSASSPVTDSAAGGTALATGHKTNNGMLGQDADTVNVYSVAKVLHDKGYGVGIVTNGAADDATPAAFYAHQPKRSMFYEIGKDAAASGFEFIAGAGLRGAKDNDLYDVIDAAGYTVLRGAQGAAKVPETSGKIMLLNPEGYGDSNEMGFITDTVGGDGVGLTLAMATQAAIDHLEKVSPDRFFMMVEGSLIDHALHGNDGSSAVREVMGLDDVVAKAWEYYQKYPEETLIIITADHDTGGMTVGCRASGYNAFPKYVDNQHISKGAFSDLCAKMLKADATPTFEEVQAMIDRYLGLGSAVKLKESQEKALREAYETTFVNRTATDEKGLYKTSNAFAAEVFRIYNDCAGWGFTTPNHTGNPVPVFAAGRGAEKFGRSIDNTEIVPTILSL